jgi:molybdopterin molybdotransferase
MERIFQQLQPPGPERVETLPLTAALNRVLAQDLLATMDVPPHTNSAMDGYALAAADLPSGSDILELPVLGNARAGHPHPGRHQPGTCLRIMTGAIMPDGTDTVVPQEHVEMLENERIRLDGRTPAGANVRRAGEDLCRGQKLLPRGRRLTPADLGIMASQGLTTVRVYRRVRVAILCTGDELRSPGEPLAPGQIYDSNRYTLTALLSRQGAEITDLGRVPDDPDQMRSVLIQAAAGQDLILTTGGVSVGETDFVRRVLEEIGGVESWKVAMKPGRPLAFGQIPSPQSTSNSLLLGLPGNPVAVMVTFAIFVEPALRFLAGEPPQNPLLIPAITDSAMRKRPGRTEYQRGILSQAADGSLRVRLVGKQGSGVLSSMARANCLIVLPHDSGPVAAGERVQVRPIDDWF